MCSHTPHNTLHYVVTSAPVALWLKVAAHAQQQQAHKLALELAAHRSQPQEKLLSELICASTSTCMHCCFAGAQQQQAHKLASSVSGSACAVICTDAG